MDFYPAHRAFESDKEVAIMNLLEKNCGVEKFRPRLDILKSCLDSLNLDLSKTKIITIAGSNGKGEVCTRISQGLSDKNVKHSLLLSPHIMSITERISLNGTNISYNELSITLEFVFEKFGDQGLSFYECLVLSFLIFSNRHDVDVMVCEIGLGGKYDGVNILDHDITGLVSISYDHQEILGETLEEICLEKLGIIRKGKKLFCGVEQDSLRELVKKTCKDFGADAVFPENEFHKKDYREKNRILAEMILEEYFNEPISLGEISFHGREEQFNSIVFNGAHNLDGIKKTMQKYYASEKKFDQIVLSFSNRPLNQINAMTKVLKSYPCVAKDVWFCELDHFKKIDHRNFELESKVVNEIDFSLNTLVLGSYYFIGELKKELSC